MNAVATADAAAITKNSKSNFALSFFSLSKEKRNAITTFYAFSRLVDDAVDEHDAIKATELIAYWRGQIDACYFGEPTHPVAKSLKVVVQRYQIPKDYLDGIINGVATDLRKNKFRDFDELSEYCFGVASLIGLVCMKIFGLKGKTAEDAAIQLGMALQFTNILRDVAIDAKKDRLYIPLSHIKEHGLSEAEIMEGYPIPKVVACLSDIADHAENYFDRAFANMETLPRKPLTAAWIMGRVYYRLLQKIRDQHFQIYQGKISISKWEKLKIYLQESWISRKAKI